MATPQRLFGEYLQSIPKGILYLLLIVGVTIPLFFPMPLPNKQPDISSVDFYKELMAVPAGSTVLLASDWTNGTRGENGSQFEAIIRILMRQRLKMALYATGDVQAPQVAIDVIQRLNQERRQTHQPEWRRWDDWVRVGYFSNSEGTYQGMNVDLRRAWQGKTDTPPNAQPADVFQSPVLQNVHTLHDVAMVIMVTPSNTNVNAIERIGGRVKLLQAVTGVMVPETRNYYVSGQISGLLGGLKGAYDVETLMQYGLNSADRNGDIPIKVAGYPNIAPYSYGDVNLDRAMKYFLSLHVALFLMIAAVLVGNIGMLLTSRRKRS